MGLTFSLVLWLIAQSAFAAGTAGPLSGRPVVHSAMAHLVYRPALGWLAGRARAE